MTVKFTTIESTKTSKIELLFEFLDYELPEYIDFEYITKLGKTVFINNLQTNQIKGIYLQPIKLEAEFVGTYYSSKETSPDRKLITAKQRADQLGRLQGQLLKFFFDGFKQIVIIENFRMRVHNQEHVEVDMTLQPHDRIEPKVFTQVEIREQLTVPLEIAPLDVKINSLLGGNFVPSTFNAQLNSLTPNQNNVLIPIKTLEGKEKALLIKRKQVIEKLEKEEFFFLQKQQKTKVFKTYEKARVEYEKLEKVIGKSVGTSPRAKKLLDIQTENAAILNKQHSKFLDGIDPFYEKVGL